MPNQLCPPPCTPDAIGPVFSWDTGPHDILADFLAMQAGMSRPVEKKEPIEWVGPAEYARRMARGYSDLPAIVEEKG